MAAQPEGTDISQVFGLIIAAFAVIYTIAKIVLDIFRKKPLEHDKRHSEKDRLYDELFSSKPEKEIEEDNAEDFDEEEDEEEIARHLPPQRKPQVAISQSKGKGWQRPEEKFVFHSTIDDYHQKTAIEERKLNVQLRSSDDLVNTKLQELKGDGPEGIKRKISPLRHMLHALPSKRALIVATELIQPPIGLRRERK